MVEDISALGLRHVGYAIPTEPGFKHQEMEIELG